jgi:hypothetical protein
MPKGREHEPMVLVPKMAREKVSLTHSIPCCPFFKFLLLYQRLYTVKLMCVYVSDCVETE